MRIIKIIATCLVLALFIQTAHAESVLVRSRSGDTGQGWLFGSPTNGQCWIAVPAHVIMSPETGRLESFHYTDMQGVSGETGIPASGGAGSRDSAADNESQDLAFAPVVAGRQAGACKSRLGVPTLKYQTIMRTAQTFNVLHMHPTSYRTFPTQLAAGAVDQYGGAVIEFSVGKDTASEFLRKGISGATIAATDSGVSVPVAMILRIKNETGTLRAMRYDYIKDRFASAETPREATVHTAPTGRGIPYRIISMLNVPSAGDTGATGLQSGSGCWRSEAVPDARTVDLTILAATAGQRIESIKVVTAPCGNAPLRYWVDQRLREDTPWEYVTACEQAANSSTDCRISLSGPRQLRLRFDARTPVAISEIRLQ